MERCGMWNMTDGLGSFSGFRIVKLFDSGIFEQINRCKFLRITHVSISTSPDPSKLVFP
ncbi:8892_t:CDS:1, partial [Acaulospora morrowiae]